jgi:hypothetical protein
MDKLEEHIRKYREELDSYSPPSGQWRRISKALNKQNISPRVWLSIAAMVVVILGAAAVLLRQANRQVNPAGTVSNDNGLIMENPQLKETEIYYNNLVNSLYSEATPLLTTNPEIKKELASDFSQIDSICTEIKKDLKDNVANQDVVEALIQNYRIKIRLLEDMLVILRENKDNPDKSKSYEL